MRGITHIFFALLLSLIIAQIWQVVWWFFPVVIFASLLPDIDYGKSVFGHWVKIVGALVEHRGIFHSLWFWLGLSVIGYFINNWIGIAVFVGYGSHLFLDAMNHAGIRWLYPFGRTKGFCKSGGVVDTMLMIMFLIADGLLVTLQVLHYVRT
jgi:membrane-bound metal-dependent hydrolase YbcI (DUF457 family)